MLFLVNPRMCRHDAMPERDRVGWAEAEATAHAFSAKEGWEAARKATYAAEMSVAFHVFRENNLSRARALLDRQRPTRAWLIIEVLSGVISGTFVAAMNQKRSANMGAPIRVD